MINPKLIFLLLFGTAILTWACRPGATPDSEASAIINAVGARNFDEARQRADRFFASETRLDSVSLSRLCSLSIAMTQLSEAGEHVSGYVAHALQCYRVAMARDSISATGFFEAMPREEYQYFAMLRQLLAPITARENGVVYTDSEVYDDNTVSPTDSSDTK